MHKLRWLCLPPLALLLAACALSPQALTIEPQLPTPAASVPGGHPIVLDVVDARKSNVVGTRGGIYSETATISTHGDITSGIRASLLGPLDRAGLPVQPPGAGGTPRLTVQIARIHYVAMGAPAVRSVRIGITVRASCRNGSRGYDGHYEVDDTTDVLTPPGPAANEKMVNASLSKALSQMLSDDKLLACLRS